MFDVARQLKRQRAVRAAHAKVTVKRRAPRQDDGHAGQRNHVVDDCGLAKQTGQCRQRGFGAHDAAFALYALEQRRLFAAHIGARALAHLQVKRLARAQYIAAQKTAALGQRDRGVQRGDGVGILRAHIDVALRGAYGQCGNGHAFDQHEGIALHGHAVREGARVALVGIADDVLLHCLRARHRLPLDTRRKRCTAAPAQARIDQRLHDGFGGHGDGVAQAVKTTIGLVVGQRARIGHAHARKGQALLARQVGNGAGRPMAQRVCAARDQARVEQSRHIAGGHRAIGHAPGGGGHFDQGFEPEQAARTVAHDVYIQAPRCRFLCDALGYRVGTHGQRGRVAGNINGDNAHAASRACATSASNLCGVMRACTCPSTVMAGDEAHRPRQ